MVKLDVKDEVGEKLGERLGMSLVVRLGERLCKMSENLMRGRVISWVRGFVKGLDHIGSKITKRDQNMSKGQFELSDR